MNKVSYRLKVVGVFSLTLLALTAGFLGFVACGTAPTPAVVAGPAPIENTVPELNIITPVEDLTVSRGQRFLIQWTDSDRDSQALISFDLIDSATSEVIALVQNIQENDDLGPDEFSVSTDLIPVADYFLRGTISDGENIPQVVFARTVEANPRNVTITVTPRGEGPLTQPPRIVVTEPAFNQSVAETDTLVIRVQPTLIPPDPQGGTPAFDPDSDATLYVLLDTDDRPDNDDPANPNDDIIVLREQTIQAGQVQLPDFAIVIDQDEVPPRPDGTPYLIRATIDDRVNPRVHAYAPGTISVVRLAAGTVDLFDVGRTLSGARWYGFNPGANLGSSISAISDFDADGTDDFVMVAQFGNPRNFGLIGEAYLVYGQESRRFGGSIAVNSVSEAVSGVILEAPPPRDGPNGEVNRGSTDQNGITDVSWIRDLTQDGRPDLLFGLAHVNAAFDSQDYDPSDEDLSDQEPDSVELVIRQGEVTVAVNDGDPEFQSFYLDTQDLVISSCVGDSITCPNGQANVTNGSGDLVYNNNGDADRQWILIKFSNVLDHFTASPFLINIPELDAEIRFRLFTRGGNASMFQALTDFNEQTTFNTFAENGGPPEPDVDYIATDLGGEGSAALGDINGDEATEVRVDVSEVVRGLLEGRLLFQNNELRFIIVPTSDFNAPVGIRSSEFSGNADSRPTLAINYEEFSNIGAVNCFPDPYVNNRTDPPNTPGQPPGDTGFYGGGMAIMLNSSNRDNDGPINPDRLESTSVALELIGQEGVWRLGRNSIDQLGGSILARASTEPTPAPQLGNDPPLDRIAGARFVAGLFDYIDGQRFNPPPRADLWGQNVASIGDMNQDGLDEIIISAPLNEQYLNSIEQDRTHYQSTLYFGSITVFPGANYNLPFWRDKATPEDSTSMIPTLDQQRSPPFGACRPPTPRDIRGPADVFVVFAEDQDDFDDFLGDGQSAGDMNLDGVPDILCGAPGNDRPGATDTGAVYIIEGRNVFGNVHLRFADDPVRRPPMVRVRGQLPGDAIGYSQDSGLDINGDRLDDVFISSPFVDFGPVLRSGCAADFNGDNVVDDSDLNPASFSNCESTFGDEVFLGDACKAFDYNNDSEIDIEDRNVFDCLSTGGGNACCENLVDNGFVGVIFGGITLDGDFDIDRIATPSLPGVAFYGGQALDRAGADVSSAGDFNKDGFGDILIAAPGRVLTDPNGRTRKGVVYLVFGGTHLQNRTFSLDLVGSPELPGIVFYSPYVAGRPNEAAPEHVALIGDINNDGFDDIAIGSVRADFINLDFPQGPNAPVDDAGAGRRRDTGDVYIIYGNNFGTNRGGGSNP